MYDRFNTRTLEFNIGFRSPIVRKQPSAINEARSNDAAADS